MMNNDPTKSSAGQQSSKWKGDGNSAESGGRRLSPTLIAFVVLAVAAVILFFRNGQTTKLDFLFITTENKTRWLVITCIAIGVVLDRLFSMWWRRRRRAKALEN